MAPGADPCLGWVQFGEQGGQGRDLPIGIAVEAAVGKQLAVGVMVEEGGELAAGEVEVEPYEGAGLREVAGRHGISPEVELSGLMIVGPGDGEGGDGFDGRALVDGLQVKFALRWEFAVGVEGLASKFGVQPDAFAVEAPSPWGLAAVAGDGDLEGPIFVQCPGGGGRGAVTEFEACFAPAGDEDGGGRRAVFGGAGQEEVEVAGGACCIAGDGVAEPVIVQCHGGEEEGLGLGCFFGGTGEEEGGEEEGDCGLLECYA